MFPYTPPSELTTHAFPINPVNNMPISTVCCEKYVAKFNTSSRVITFGAGQPWKNPYCC